MSISELQKRTIRDFKGAFTAGDEIAAGPRSSSLSSYNIEYHEGSFSTRTGFADSTVPDGSTANSMYNWVFVHPTFGLRNYLIWFGLLPGFGNGMRYCPFHVSPAAAQNGYLETSAQGATFADDSGGRLYAAQYTATGIGVGHVRVASAQDTYGSGPSGLWWDNCFPRPMFSSEVTIAPALTTGGHCTPGHHLLAFIIERRSGYIGRPGPVTNATPMVLAPGSVDTTSANNKVTVTVTPTANWPSDAVRIHLLATTATNPARWLFVPGGKAPITTGSTLPGAPPVPAVLTFDISDADLAGTADEATANLSYLSQDKDGNPPFTPHAVFRFSDRICYCVNDTTYGTGIFFSERRNAQALTASKHFIPFRQHVVNGFEFFGVGYVYGDNWTFSIQDSGQVPVLWPAPREVDRAIGSPSPHGVFVSGVAQGLAWVASKAGLYRFVMGKYEVTPTSRYQKEWAQIDWTVPSLIQVADEANTKCVFVRVDPGTLQVWDYVDGADHVNAKFSVHQIGFGWMIGAIGIVQNNDTKILELWLGPGQYYNRFRRRMKRNEINAYLDGGQPYDSSYVSAPMLAGKAEFFSLFQAIRIRATGSARVQAGFRQLDGVKSTMYAPELTISGSPGEWFTVRPPPLLANDCSVVMTCSQFDSAPGSHFSVAAIEVLYSRHADIRGFPI